MDNTIAGSVNTGSLTVIHIQTIKKQHRFAATHKDHTQRPLTKTTHKDHSQRPLTKTTHKDHSLSHKEWQHKIWTIQSQGQLILVYWILARMVKSFG